MEIQSLIHEHDLTPCDDVDNKECDSCRRLFSGLGYSCSTEYCKRYYCKSCYHLPTEVRHHLHPQHVLKLTLDADTDSRVYHDVCSYPSSKYFFCDGCKTTRLGFSYRCSHGDCKFILHIKCTFSNLKHDYANTDIKPIWHYGHVHQLVNTKCHKYQFPCRICEQIIGGSRGNCYGCLDCAFFVHEDCLETPQIIQHPVHSHPLRLESFYERIRSSVICQACCCHTFGSFRCGECDFKLQVNCAESLLHTLNHNCHQHPLWYLSKNIPKRGLFPCCLCSATNCREEGSFYRCVQCNLNFHIECLNLPQTVKHKNHMHSLILVNKVLDEEYYCDVCELQKDPETHAYYCEECSFVSHIECALTKENLSWKMFNLAAYDPDIESDEEDASHTKMISNEEQYESSGSLISTANEPQKIKVKHIHQHVLFLNEVIHASEGLDCNVCYQQIRHFGYTCERCEFWIHKSCSKLPKDMVHPIHPDHSLTLLQKFPHFNKNDFICCNCRVISKGMCFYCRVCDFFLDTNCASLVENAISDYDHDQQMKRGNKKIVLTRFSMELELAVVLEKHNAFCGFCYNNILGSCYYTKYYGIHYHESCLEPPIKIQHILHPQHSIFLEKCVNTFVCNACPNRSYTMYGIYSCHECRFTLHTRCAISIQRSLNHTSLHEHSLYIFLTNDKGALNFLPDITFSCTICGEMCVGYFYRCVDCKINFHSDCLPLPHILKHNLTYERHPLILEDRFVEDDSGEYYCDVCEHPRDGEHPVYCCKECSYFAHIECIISEEYISAEVLRDSAKEDDIKGHVDEENENGNADKEIPSSNLTTQDQHGDEAKDEGEEAYHGYASDERDYVYPRRKQGRPRR